MASVAELEAQLVGPCDTWDRGVLAVYADALQASGDLRGELIAIDLALEVNGPTSKLEARRRELLSAWLGVATMPQVLSHRFGTYALQADQFRQRPLEQPSARYLAGVTLTGVGPVITSTLRLLAAAPRPFLARLELHIYEVRYRLDMALWKRVVMALPALDTLSVGGGMLGRLHHPSIRRLELRDENTSNASPAPFATVTDLVLENDAQPRAHLFPAVRRLDVSRATLPISETCAELLPKLTHVALPNPGRQTRAEIQEAIDRMPALVEATLVSGRPDDWLPTHSQARIRFRTVVRWPTMEEVAHAGLAITIAGTDVLVNLVDAVNIANTHHAELPDDARAAWDTFWELATALQQGQVSTIRGDVLFALVRDLPERIRIYQPQWARLREAVVAAAPAADASLAIRARYA
jgi:hypothetical protein